MKWKHFIFFHKMGYNDGMKVVYLINSKEYKYHLRMSEDFATVVPGKVVDMSDGKPFGDRYYEIEEMHPDAIITFDLAGHVLRTGNDTLSLNNIYARFAHILFHRSDRYGSDLKFRQNLSMFTYFVNGEDIGSCRDRLPEVPNIREFAPIDYKSENNSERERIREVVSVWWKEFSKEAML